MNRYDIFNNIHKALRAMLYETALCLQQTDFNNEDETDTSLTQLNTVIDLFDKHAHTEDSIVFEAIKNKEPLLVHIFEKEHEEDHKTTHLILFFNRICRQQRKSLIRIAGNWYRNQ